MPTYYYVGPQPVDHEIIALADFGGDIGDPVGAALRVRGWRRVSILRPRAVDTGGPDIKAAYQHAVRDLALTYDFKSRYRRGRVDIVWDPAEGKTKQYEEPGEPVDRVV